MGADNGSLSFKASFQVVNVSHPNQPNNTVIVFSIHNAKYLRSNMILYLERFKAHIDKFSNVQWDGKKFLIFLFGDYEFLCKVYGLYGACRRHSVSLV